MTDSQRLSIVSSKYNDGTSSCMDMEDALPASIHGGTTLSPSIGLCALSPDAKRLIPSPMVPQTYFRQRDFGLGLLPSAELNTELIQRRKPIIEHSSSAFEKNSRASPEKAPSENFAMSPERKPAKPLQTVSSDQPVPTDTSREQGHAAYFGTEQNEPIIENASSDTDRMWE